MMPPFALVLVLATGFSASALAQVGSQTTTNAKWDLQDRAMLTINVSDLLTPSQRDIINSGFTTFSMFSVGETKDSDGQKVPIRRMSCTVKYDTWEDRYEVTRLDPPPPTSVIVKDYRDWSKDCLEVAITDAKLISSLETDGSISATLIVRQSTVDESAHIKSWLVKQQSGFMQGLYSHMLGNFQYQNLTHIKVRIPKRPSNRELGSGT